MADAVAALKQDDEGDLRVIGSTQLAQTLTEHDLVDEFRLMIDPLVLGAGKALFADDGGPEDAATRRQRGDVHGRDSRHLRARRRHLTRTSVAVQSELAALQGAIAGEVILPDSPAHEEARKPAFAQ